MGLNIYTRSKYVSGFGTDRRSTLMEYPVRATVRKTVGALQEDAVTLSTKPAAEFGSRALPPRELQFHGQTEI